MAQAGEQREWKVGDDCFVRAKVERVGTTDGRSTRIMVHLPDGRGDHFIWFDSSDMRPVSDAAAEQGQAFDEWWNEVGWRYKDRTDRTICEMAWNAARYPRIKRCQAMHPEGGQCELREGHNDALKGKHLAGMIIWGEELRAAPSQPVGRERELREVLESGLALVESAFAHVSHGGPTRGDAEKWIAVARAALSGTGSEESR